MSEQTAADAGERTGNYDTVEDFNRECPIGTPVLAFPGSRDGRALYTKTRSTAWMIGPEPVVMVEGYAGGIALTHIEVVPPTQPPAAPEADVRLTQAEKDALWDATDRAYVDTTTWDHEVESEVERTVEHIVAERVRVVEGERDAARREERMRAEDHANAWREVAIVTARAESAEAAHAEGMAKAWDEGHRAGVMWDHTQHTDGTYSPDANPYRHDGAR